MSKLEGKMPDLSSSWLVGPGGAVHELRAGRPKPSQSPVDRKRAAVTCGRCGNTGHNARNKKLCPAWVDPDVQSD